MKSIIIDISRDMFPDGDSVTLGREKPPFNTMGTIKKGQRVRWVDRGDTRYYLRNGGDVPITFFYVPLAKGPEFDQYIENLKRIADEKGT